MRSRCWLFVGVMLAFLAGCQPSNQENLLDFDLEILRSFERPIVFSTRSQDDRIYLRTRIRGGRWGSETQTIEWDRERLLDLEQASRLRVLLAAVDFKASVDTSDMRDGDQWCLRVRNGWPRTTTQYSPDVYHGSLENAGLAAFGAYLWSIADLDAKEIKLRLVESKK